MRATWPSPSEILVSQTVRDLVAGSGLTFEERGTYVLKGVPDFPLFNFRYEMYSR